MHGGAGSIDGARDELLRAGCAKAAAVGAAVLEAGGPALDAVVAAVEVLEEDPEFNAGHGAVLNRAGEIEVDACVMTGERRIGSVAAVPWLRHPVRLARLVLDDGEHVLLCGPGALGFAREHGIEPDAPAQMISDRARARFEDRTDRRGDTVGACALDRDSGLAAATSTGGIARKRPGRVGDSPLPGAGTWAEEAYGAVSATGDGEAIIRALSARRAVEMLASGHLPIVVAEAVALEIAEVGGGEGGLILVDREGRIGYACNAAAMPWASVVGDTARSGVLRPARPAVSPR
ncbi:MAG: isoaspartyl peptidase/L-asparaginase [Candidatus Binatia bacterium]|nr:isoaspartyl peptidase/L-asparaginase [Candidatus Binatia bacterium]